MSDGYRGGLFRTRNILGTVLVAGAVIGWYLPDFWKGLGGGSSIGVGIGDPQTEPKTRIDQPESEESPPPEEITASEPKEELTLIKILIDDRSYLLRADDGDQVMPIEELMEKARNTIGDSDGVRIRIYRKGSSRVSAEDVLKQSLAEAGIKETAIVWMPTPVE